MRPLCLLGLLVLLSCCGAAEVEEDESVQLENQIFQLQENLRKTLKRNKKKEEDKNKLLREHEAKMKEARLERQEHREEQARLLEEVLDSNEQLQKMLVETTKKVEQQAGKLHLMLNLEHDENPDPQLNIEDDPNGEKNITLGDVEKVTGEIVEQVVRVIEGLKANETQIVTDAPERRGVILGDELTGGFRISVKNQLNQLSNKKSGIEDRLELSANQSGPEKPLGSPVRSELLDETIDNQQETRLKVPFENTTQKSSDEDETTKKRKIGSSKKFSGHKTDTSNKGSKRPNLPAKNVLNLLGIPNGGGIINKKGSGILELPEISEVLNGNVYFKSNTSSAKSEVSSTEESDATQPKFATLEAITSRSESNENASHEVEIESEAISEKFGVAPTEELTSSRLSASNTRQSESITSERATTSEEEVSGPRLGGSGSIQPESITSEVTEASVQPNENDSYQVETEVHPIPKKSGVTFLLDKIAGARLGESGIVKPESIFSKVITTSEELKKKPLRVAPTEEVSNTRSGENDITQPESINSEVTQTSGQPNENDTHLDETESNTKESGVARTEEVASARSSESNSPQPEFDTSEGTETSGESNEDAGRQAETGPKTIFEKLGIVPPVAISNRRSDENDSGKTKSTNSGAVVQLNASLRIPTAFNIFNPETSKKSEIYSTKDATNVGLDGGETESELGDDVSHISNVTENYSKKPEVPIDSSVESDSDNDGKSKIDATFVGDFDEIRNFPPLIRPSLKDASIHKSTHTKSSNAANLSWNSRIRTNPSRPVPNKSNRQKQQRRKLTRQPTPVRDLLRKAEDKRHQRLEKYKQAKKNFEPDLLFG